MMNPMRKETLELNLTCKRAMLCPNKEVSIVKQTTVTN